MDINKEPPIMLECVDSTNNYAMQRVHNGSASDRDAWFAMEQTGGRGRHSKLWEAKRGENILMTVVIKAGFLPVYQQFMLSASVALACYSFFKLYAFDGVSIKWPNDLFWNDRKAGGILIENIINGNIWQWAVIGIGININQTSFSSANKRAVSLREITGKSYDPAALARQLYAHLISNIDKLKGEGVKNILNSYNNVLYKKNQPVKLKKQNVIFETTISGVSKLGQLHTIDSMERYFDFNEIEWIL